MESTAVQRRRRVIPGVLIISLTAIALDNTVLNIALTAVAGPSTGLGASQSAAASIALVFFAMGGAYFFISFSAQNVRGFSPRHAGLLSMVVAAGQLAIATWTSGRAARAGRPEARPAAPGGPVSIAGAVDA